MTTKETIIREAEVEFRYMARSMYRRRADFWNEDEGESGMEYYAVKWLTSTLHKVYDAAQTTLAGEMLQEVERLDLEVNTVVCDCGRPYKDSDLADLITSLKSKLQSLTPPNTN